VLTAPEVERITDQGLLLFAAPLLLAGMLYAYSMQMPNGRDDLHGSARWATRKDIEQMSYFAGKGVYVGGWWDKQKREQLYLRHNGPEHILCFAPTRSGKGVGLILPTLLAWEHSSVVLDIKGENYALTGGYLKSQGHTVLRFEPSDPSGTSASFNPLEEIRLESERAIADVQQIANMVLDPEGKGLTDYWNKAAFGFFGGVLLHCLITTRQRHGRPASLYDVSLMLEDPDRDGGPTALFEEIIDTDHAAMLADLYPDVSLDQGRAAHIFCASAASGMLAKADKEMAGVVSTATSNLALYRDPVVARNISACGFRINDLMNHATPVNLYLVVPPSDIARLRPLLRIFMTQLLGRLTEKMEFAGGASTAGYRHRLLLMLDEFTSLGRLPIIEHAIAYMAGYGVKGYFIVQDTKQLSAAYGQDNALMANCHVRIAYAPNLPETAEYLSKLTGTTTVVTKKASLSRGKSGGSRSLSVSETSRPLLTPDECLRLPGAQKDASGKVTAPGDMLIFTAGQSPIYGRQILYFLDPVFSARAKVAPPKVSDRLTATKPAVEASAMATATATKITKDEYEKFLDA
jgi:type IV secretion system protein VirD4